MIEIRCSSCGKKIRLPASTKVKDIQVIMFCPACKKIPGIREKVKEREKKFYQKQRDRGNIGT